MFTVEQVIEAHEYYAGRFPTLTAYLQPYCEGRLTISPSPKPRSRFAWYVSAILGQRVSFTRARTRRHRLFHVCNTCDVTREHIRSLDMALVLGESDVEVIKRIDSLTSTQTDAELASAYGVGEWTVANVRFMESVSTLEEGKLPEAIHIPKDKMLSRLRERHNLPAPEMWGKYRGLVTWLLWRPVSK